HDRLKVYLRDQGIAHDVIDACLAMDGNDDFVSLVARAKALQAFLKTDDGENLVQGFKRANNILTAEETKDGVFYEMDPDPKYAEDASETALFDALAAAKPEISAAVTAETFEAAMGQMAGLRAPIDAFFEAVQINTDNQIVRRNRLCLLNQIRVTLGQIADFTKLEG
ncbi:MAG: DALR anticodon-binding domain-containing protein, partial [Pseudomonadota bacterium]